jgi:hypothetical protein
MAEQVIEDQIVEDCQRATQNDAVIAIVREI